MGWKASLALTACLLPGATATAQRHYLRGPTPPPRNHTRGDAGDYNGNDGWGDGHQPAQQHHHHYRHGRALAGVPTRHMVNEGVTVVLNTFKRPDMMRRAVEHYTQCEVVDAMRVVWTEGGAPPNTHDWNIGLLETKRAPRLRFDTQPDSLNSRFRPLEDLHTHAIFAVDDDIQVSCEDLAFAFETWTNAERTLVGFYPRLHTLRDPNSGSSGGYEYHSWWYVWWRGEYSMVLTKAAIMHRDYMKLYTVQMAQSIRDYVDQHMNCEDVAMQFLVANISARPPIFVRGAVGDLGALGGISTRSGHMGSRTDCLNDMHRLFVAGNGGGGGGGGRAPDFGEMPLVSSHVVVGRAGSWFSNQPVTWFEYLASDLPVPIWFEIVLILCGLAAVGRLGYECCCGSLVPGRGAPLGGPRKHLKA